MTHMFTNCAAIFNEDVEAVGTTGRETKRNADLTELCLLTASGFYSRGKVENREN